MVLVMGAPFWSRGLAAKRQASGEARNEGDVKQSTPLQLGAGGAHVAAQA